MAQLEHIEAIEKRLWYAVDTLRVNSKYDESVFLLPVMGLLFLRDAYRRYLIVRRRFLALSNSVSGRRGPVVYVSTPVAPVTDSFSKEHNIELGRAKTRTLTKKDCSKEGAIFLKPKAQFDYLATLPDSENRARAIIKAMESVEGEYANLRGVLPKKEYQELDNDVLGELLRILDPGPGAPAVKVSDVRFGREYEHFITRFAYQKAHNNGPFCTPVSLISLVTRVLEPRRGTLLDPACGSGCMFVHAARLANQLTFRGLEKDATIIRLAKMHLAVHGLKGDIQQAITYYEDPHDFQGKADFVISHPPFDVDDIDAAKIKTDPRLPFGLPTVSRDGKVRNGNYVWISYFYSYLKARGQAGFIMSSKASGARGRDAKVRQKLVETGDVDIIIAIGPNFFHTHSSPCELWFLNRDRPEAHRDKVLMIDARNVCHTVTSEFWEFSPEQERNLLAIVWLYRAQTERFLGLVSAYLGELVYEGENTFQPLAEYGSALSGLRGQLDPFLRTQPETGPHADTLAEFEKKRDIFSRDVEYFEDSTIIAAVDWRQTPDTESMPHELVKQFTPLAKSSWDLVKQGDVLYKLASELVKLCENECDANACDAWVPEDAHRALKAADEARQAAAEPFRQLRYFWQQAHWLTERFPEAKLRDVEGLVKLVDRAEIESNGWSLTPGRYVGVAPENEEPLTLVPS